MWRKTPTKEQKQWLKDNGYTEKQIDAFWEDCRSTNRVINAISNEGGTWRDMSIFVLKELPTQKQRDLEYIKNKKEEEQKEKDRLAKAEAEKKYYPDINRWTQNVETIIKIRDKYFAFRWQLGLTEYQENSYDLEPVEVFPNTYEKTIAITEWLPV